MELVTKVKLLPTREQAALLQQTLEQANAACNVLSAIAWQAQRFGQWAIHEVGYRGRFPLSSQVVIRCIAKVAHAYKGKKHQQQQFKFHKHGSIAYDARILTWYQQTSSVSIWTVGGRQHIPYTCPQWQHDLLKQQQGETRLQFRKGNFYLLTTLKVAAKDEIPVGDYLGLDLGIENIVTDSDGYLYSGSQLQNTRVRHDKVRAKLQKKGTKSAKRLLKKRSGTERRFRENINHTLSKQVVQQAQRTKRGIALENLKGIRARIRAKKPQRTHLHRWAFADLRQKIHYKAAKVGIPVVIVSPEYTSQMCASCGAIDKRNRPAQSTFRCMSCGHAAHADVNAAINIACKARTSSGCSIGG